MSIIVEDGTGKADAESYISVADATAYHLEMGNAAWAALASDTVREQLLRKATAYMLQSYRFKWSGQRKTTTQNTDFPRYMMPIYDVWGGTGYYYDFSSVPKEVKNACAALALKANTVTLLPDIEPIIISESIAGAISVQHDPNSTPYTRFSEIEAMLKPFFTNAGSQGFIHR